MSEHKTDHSNWTAEQKKLYWERRAKGLRGQTGYVQLHTTVQDDEGNDQRIPHSGAVSKSMRKFMGKRQAKRQQVRADKRQVKATSRGN